MSDIPAPLRAKLGKMLRMTLGAATPEEADTARAALNRTLSANGLDMHDLTAVLENEPAPVLPAAPARAEAMPVVEREDGRFEMPAATVLELVDAIRTGVLLSDWSTGFLVSMRERAERWDPVFLSPKQFNAFTNLVRRLP